MYFYHARSNRMGLMRGFSREKIGEPRREVGRIETIASTGRVVSQRSNAWNQRFFAINRDVLAWHHP